MKDKFSVTSAQDLISRTGVKVSGNLISHKRPGLKVLSAIDYLCNYCKHIWAQPVEEAERA